MPIISSFYGIYIKMFFIQKEHNPPHIHAIYNEFYGEISIKTLKMFKGDLPPHALKLVQKWGKMHQEALQKMWEEQKITKLPPLK